MDLKKNLGFIDVFCIACGAMISSGIFILPGLAFARTGPIVFISYLLAGILALVGILSVLELATAMPRAGGDYYFITRSLGPLLGTVSGFLSWFALSLKSSFAIYGLAEVVHLWSGMGLFVIGLVATLIFTGVNLFGVKEAAKLEVVLSLALIALMILFVGFGAPKIRASHFEPFLFEGKNMFAVLSTAGFVFISFGGLLNVTSISEEIKNPRVNLPWGLVSSILVITTLYVLLLTVTVGVMTADQLTNSLTPVADAANLIMGRPGYIAISIAAILAFVTTANAGIMSAARYPLALGRDNLIPHAISKVTEKGKTPVIAICITALFIILSLLMPLEMLVKAASTVILTSYLLSSVAVIILRESKIQNYRPTFKTPFYPWLQIVTIILFLMLIIDMGMQAVEISLGLVAVSLLFFAFYGRRSDKEYALLHVIERITNKKLTDNNLEKELKSIIKVRDDIVHDEFDECIKDALVLDLSGPFNLTDFFRNVAVEIAKDDQTLTEDTIFDMLMEREQESSTALNSFVAVPHIIAEGENIFKIVLVRCREGVTFSEQYDSVKAVFFIFGTRDQRHHHLRSLAAIAQIIQGPNFETRWEEAKEVGNLRDVILLAKRKRA